MSWNYRIAKRTHPDGSVEYSIHECYYGEKETDISLTVNPVTVSTFSEPEDDSTDENAVEELRQTLIRMQEALNKPVVDYDKL